MNTEIQERSFAAKAKDEICQISAELPTCCYHAMSYGLLLCGRSFSSSSMMLVTEHRGTAELYSKAVADIIGKEPEIKEDIITIETGSDKNKLRIMKWAVSTVDKPAKEKKDNKKHAEQNSKY